jgi:hypothetical protein
MILKLYNSLTQHVLLNAACNQFFAVEYLRDTPRERNPGCLDYIFLCRRRLVILLCSEPLKVMVFTTKNIQGISIKLLSSC